MKNSRLYGKKCTSVLQFRVRCWVGVPHQPCVPGLGLRDRWLLLSHSLEGFDPEDPELECLTLPTCVCAWCCCWPDKLSVKYMHTMDGDWEVHTHLLGHRLRCIYMYKKLENQVQWNSKIPTSMQTKPWQNAWPTSGCVYLGVEHIERPKETEAGLSFSCHIPHILTSSICNTHILTHTETKTGT